MNRSYNDTQPILFEFSNIAKIEKKFFLSSPLISQYKFTKLRQQFCPTLPVVSQQNSLSVKKMGTCIQNPDCRKSILDKIGENAKKKEWLLPWITIGMKLIELFLQSL